MNLTTRQRIEERIEQTTGQHTRWLRFDDQMCAWFNGSDFVCQMNRWDRKDGTPATDAAGEGLITEWAPRHQLPDAAGFAAKREGGLWYRGERHPQGGFVVPAEVK